MSAGKPQPIDLDSIDTFAANFSEQHALDTVDQQFDLQRWQGDRCWAVLHLDDVSGIPFLDGIQGVDEYQHRARLRCGDGDLFATVTEPAAGYEEYCRDQLLLGSPRHIFAFPPDGALRVSNGCLTAPTFSTLVDCARSGQGLLIEPYMGIEDSWNLAARIQHEAKVPVQVMAPPPAVTWIANDKAHFSELVAGVLGDEALVLTRAAEDVATLAEHLRQMFAGVQRVAIKRTRCASAMGNRLLEVEQLQPLDERALQKVVEEALLSMAWPAGEEVLACVWEETDLSPSTQWWIPPKGSALPRIDGIYEQILAGEEKLFVGSRPSTLPDEINQGLERQSFAIAYALQQLGYVGRCSFDHLVVGDLDRDPQLKVTECNGRWGGTSTPMHLVDRVISGDRPPYRAQDFIHQDLIGVPFTEICQRIGGHLFDASSGEGQFLLYNVGPLTLSGKFDVIAIAESSDEADRWMTEGLPELLGV
ncbi:MAG: hypothetical protein HOA95_01515 [Planctomycetes bacterium]|nr:hypothetical protein [Planctomycetota bacterium]